jgi:type II secretory pathway component PulJ
MKPTTHNLQPTTNKGFTIIELVIYTTILLILLLLTSRVFTSLIESQVETTATSATEEDSRYILAKLSSDISRADSVTTPATNGTTGNTLTLVINGLNSTYSLNGTTLQLSDNIGINQLNSFGTTVSNLTFQRLGNSGGKPTIQIAFTLTSTTKRTQGFEVKNYSTTIGTR